MALDSAPTPEEEQIANLEKAIAHPRWNLAIAGLAPFPGHSPSPQLPCRSAAFDPGASALLSPVAGTPPGS